MGKIEKEIEAYMTEIKKNLICPTSEQNRIIDDIKNNILDFVDENNITDIDKVYEHFGDPKDIAGQFLEDVEPGKIKKAVNIRKVLIIAAIVIIAIIAVTLLITIINSHNSVNGHFVDDPIVETAKIAISTAIKKY